MAFASIPDVEAILRRTLTAEEQVFVNRLLDMADAEIEAELPGVSLDGVVTGATATFQHVLGDELWLPGRPVNQVTQVTFDGDPVPTDDYWVSPWGPLRRRCGAWPDLTDIAVTWDYGYATVPADVVNIAADLVAAQVNDPNGIRQVAVGQYSETRTSRSVALELTSDHRRRLGRYRVRRTSIPVETDNPWWRPVFALREV